MDIVASKLIHTDDLFVNNPIDAYSRMIERKGKSKIILTGGRGTGKSVLLQQLENRNAGTKNPYIYTSFESIGCDGLKSFPHIFNEVFFKHYYELLLAYNLLHYMETYYKHTFQNSFKKEQQYIKEQLRQTDDYINNFMFKDISLKPISQKEITGDILDKFKKMNELNGINICIDRFDWINNSDELTQRILNNYFDLFHKVILTCDDEEFIDKRTNFGEFNPFYKNYNCIDSTKIHSTLSIKWLLLKRIASWNKKMKSSSMPKDWLTDNFINLMIEKTNGNIYLMITVVNRIFNYSSFHGNITEQQCEEQLNEEIEHTRQLRKMNANSPKFYL